MSEKSKAGRPTSFPKSQMSAIRKLCLLGATDKDIADAYNVTEQTINNWKIKHPEFFESLKDWKLEADNLVEQSLYNRAIGCDVPDDKVFNNNGEALIVKSRKHYPPDATSAIFWLKNRKPDQWRERPIDEDKGGEDLASALNNLANKLPS